MPAKKLLVGVVAVVVLLCGFGVARAAIPNTDHTVSACYANSTGVVRVIDTEAGETCGQNATPLALTDPDFDPGLHIVDNRTVVGSGSPLAPGESERLDAFCPVGTYALLQYWDTDAQLTLSQVGIGFSNRNLFLVFSNYSDVEQNAAFRFNANCLKQG